jgi:Domain of unknown function (DUF4386)
MARSTHAADPTRKAAFAAGLFYLITFLASIPAALMLAPILTDPAYILGPGADEQIRLACLLDLVNALAAVGSAVAVFSVIRRHHEGLALGFVSTRMFEAATIVVGIVSLLAVVTIREAGPATATDGSSLVAVGQGLVGVRDWTFVIGPGLMPGFNALMFATVLYRSRLVPRAIPALGLVGAPLLIASATGMILGLHDATSAFAVIATAPIFVWELAIGLWMTCKGFDHDAVMPARGRTADEADVAAPPAARVGRSPVRLPAPHRLWLVPGIAAGVAASVVSERYAMGLIPVLVFGILPHAPVVLGLGGGFTRGGIRRQAMLLFDALHQPLVPIAVIAVAGAGLVGPLWLVAGLAWLGHIVVDLGLGDGHRDADGTRRARSWSREALVARLARPRAGTPAV